MPQSLWTPAGAVVELEPPSDDEVIAELGRVLHKAANHSPDDVTSWAEYECQVLQDEAVVARLTLRVIDATSGEV